MICKKRGWFISVTCIFMLLIYLPQAQAEAQAGLRVIGGLTREFTASAGDTIVKDISIENTGNEPLEVDVYLRDYFYNRKGITKYRQPGTTYRSNADWIQLNPEDTITVPPQSRTNINYTINIPADAELYGTYWSMLMVEPREGIELFEDPEGRVEVQTGIRQISRYGVQIRTHIGDIGTQELSVMDRRVIQTAEEGKVYLELDLENKGTRWFRVELRAEFYDVEGYFKTKVDGPSASLYPGTSVRRRMEITDIDPGDYQVLVIFEGRGVQVWGARYNLSIE